MKKILSVVMTGFILVLLTACSQEENKYFDDWTREERAGWDLLFAQNWILFENAEALFLERFQVNFGDENLLIIYDEMKIIAEEFYNTLRGVHENRVTLDGATESMSNNQVALETIKSQLLAMEIETAAVLTSEFNHFFESYLKIIGDINYGFMKIPENWIRFVDASGVQGLLQYTDFGWNIVTVSVAELPYPDFAAFANNHQNLFDAEIIEPVTSLSLQDGINAYRHMVNIGGKYLIGFIIERPTTMLGNLQMITIEGSRAEIEELARLVEQTFRFRR